MKYTYTCPECSECQVEFDVTPGSECKPCQNHDAKEFSDPGSDPTIEGPGECPECHEKFDMGAILEAALEACGGHDDPPEREDDDR